MFEDKKKKKNIKCSNCKKLKKEVDEYKINWQRALADYQNLQKETEKRRGEWVKMSKETILVDFIPVYENFKKAFGTEDGDMDGWKTGIKYIMKQFGDILKSHGIEDIKTVGEKFDPNLHEIVGEEKGKEPNLILKEVSGGYKMGDRVIKVAKIIISK